LYKVGRLRYGQIFRKSFHGKHDWCSKLLENETRIKIRVAT